MTKHFIEVHKYYSKDKILISVDAIECVQQNYIGTKGNGFSVYETYGDILNLIEQSMMDVDNVTIE